MACDLARYLLKQGAYNKEGNIVILESPLDPVGEKPPLIVSARTLGSSSRSVTL